MGHGHVQRAEPEPRHGVGVVAELAGREDLDLDRAVGRLLDVLLEGQRGGMLRLVGPGGLEVGVLEDLLLGQGGRREGEQHDGQGDETLRFSTSWHFLLLSSGLTSEPEQPRQGQADRRDVHDHRRAPP